MLPCSLRRTSCDAWTRMRGPKLYRVAIVARFSLLTILDLMVYDIEDVAQPGHMDSSGLITRTRANIKTSAR